MKSRQRTPRTPQKQGPLTAAARRRWSPALLLPLAIALGVVLRLIPCLRDPGFEFVVDASYHERLTREVVRTGRLAAIDPMSEAPEGRGTADHLPLGLYRLGAMSHRVLDTVGSHDLRWNLAVMTAVAGALIAIPVWLGVVALTGNGLAAGLAALLAVFLPAHLQRTFGFCLRYDAPGTLFAALHAALGLVALTSPRSRSRWMAAIGAAIALIAALWFWRVGLLVLELECLAAAVALVWRGRTPEMRALWSALALIGTLGLAPIAYLAAHRFLLSAPWLAVVGIAVACWLPLFDSRRSWVLRLGVATGLAALVSIAARHDPSADYANLAPMLAARFGLAHAPGALGALMLDVQELRGLSPVSLLFDPQRLVVMGVWLLAAPVLLWRFGKRSASGLLAELSPAVLTLTVVTLGLVIATLAFERAGVLLAPFVAIVLGVLAARLGAFRSTSAARVALWALALSAAATAVVALQQTTTAWARLDHNESDALSWLRAHGSPGDVVVCDWDAGYDVQTRAGMATVVDGFLESANNRQRIIELYRAFIDSSSEPLKRLCARTHARWVLTPPGTAIPSMAHVAGGPLWDAVARGEAIGPGPMMEHTIVHLVGNDRDLPGFRRALTAGPFQIYEVTADGAPDDSLRSGAR